MGKVGIYLETKNWKNLKIFAYKTRCNHLNSIKCICSLKNKTKNLICNHQDSKAILINNIHHSIGFKMNYIC